MSGTKIRLEKNQQNGGISCVLIRTGADSYAYHFTLLEQRELEFASGIENHLSKFENIELGKLFGITDVPSNILNAVKTAIFREKIPSSQEKGKQVRSLDDFSEDRTRLSIERTSSCCNLTLYNSVLETTLSDSQISAKLAKIAEDCKNEFQKEFLREARETDLDSLAQKIAIEIKLNPKRDIDSFIKSDFFKAAASNFNIIKDELYKTLQTSHNISQADCDEIKTAGLARIEFITKHAAYVSSLDKTLSQFTNIISTKLSAYHNRTATQILPLSNQFQDILRSLIASEEFYELYISSDNNIISNFSNTFSNYLIQTDKYNHGITNTRVTGHKLHTLLNTVATYFDSTNDQSKISIRDDLVSELHKCFYETINNLQKQNARSI